MDLLISLIFCWKPCRSCHKGNKKKYYFFLKSITNQDIKFEYLPVFPRACCTENWDDVVASVELEDVGICNKGVGKGVGDGVGGGVGDGVGEGVGVGVGDGVGEGVGEGVGDGVGEGVGDGVGEGVGDGVGEGVGEGVGDGVGTALHWQYETLLQSVMRLLSKSLQIPKNKKKINKNNQILVQYQSNIGRLFI